jgi:hypothetical protein
MAMSRNQTTRAAQKDRHAYRFGLEAWFQPGGGHRQQHFSSCGLIVLLAAEMRSSKEEVALL